MVREVYGVHLSVEEKGRLKKMIRAGRGSAQAVTRARILLKTDEGWTAARVAAAFDVAGADGAPSQAPLRGGRTGGGAAAPQLAHSPL